MELKGLFVYACCEPTHMDKADYISKKRPQMFVLKCERQRGSLSSCEFIKFSKSHKHFACNGKRFVNLPATDNKVDNENRKI